MELKAVNIPLGKEDWYYPKSEADKYILKLKADLVRWQDYSHLGHVESLRQLRHSKRKRCLDNVKICEMGVKIWEPCVYDVEGAFQKYSLYERWKKRWLELAEKFK